MKKKIIAAACLAAIIAFTGCASSETSGSGSNSSSSSTKSSKSEGSSSKPNSNADNSSAKGESKPEEDSAPEETSTPAASESIDWSKIPVVDEMDLDYMEVAFEDIEIEGFYIEEYVPLMTSYFKDGGVFITKYYGDAEYINVPDTIDGKKVLALCGVDWGKTAKAIKLPAYMAEPTDIRLTTRKSLNNTVKGTNIETIVCPEGWQNIGSFNNLSNLVGINIPKSVTTIFGSAFSSCSKLESIEIPDSVTEILSNAFYNCESLKSITIPDSVTLLGYVDYYGNKSGGTFWGCTSLKEIKLPKSITEIFPDTFKNCTSLESIVIPDGVTEIGKEAFFKCTSLKSIDIPDSVTYIGRNAFNGCEGISINFKGKTYNENNVEKIYDKDLSSV